MSTIQSPLPGIFYRKPSPDAEPFVTEGSEVTEGQTIGLIEVMKNFTELSADNSGTLVTFFVEHAGEVTVGQDIAEIS